MRLGSIPQGSATSGSGKPVPRRLFGVFVLATSVRLRLGSVIVRHYLREGATVVLTGRNRGKLEALRDVPADLLHTGVLGDDLEGGIDAALQQHGLPTTIVSTPFVPLPDKLFAHPDAPADAILSPEEFRQMVQDNLTHPFRVAPKTCR
jgi:NAD(P)-dependent dehydrogenase (short-subunit alcohol dehydrogenase family)